MNNKGFTLIEILVATFIGSLCVLLLFSLLVLSEKNTQRIEERRDGLQDQAVVRAFFKQEIQAAGYVGCASRLLSQACLGSAINITHQGDSDVLEVRRLKSPLFSLAAPVQGDVVLLNNVLPKIKAKQVLVVADCLHCRKVSVAGAVENKGQQHVDIASALFFPRINMTTVSLLIKDVFFIAKNKRGVGLFEQHGQALPQELVHNVSAMQIVALGHGLYRFHFSMRGVEKDKTFSFVVRSDNA
jgi:prepilin-type N-terminal cleavage/methylation domain-containing protein